jgi:hypothetical protein
MSDEKERRTLDAALLRKTLEGLGDNPYRKFNIAFSLMSVIPMLTFFYLLAGKLFTLNILTTNVGLILFIVIFISLCGYYVGYTVIKNFLDRVITYVLQITKYNEQLRENIVEVFESPLDKK